MRRTQLSISHDCQALKVKRPVLCSAASYNWREAVSRLAWPDRLAVLYRIPEPARPPVTARHADRAVVYVLKFVPFRRSMSSFLIRPVPPPPPPSPYWPVCTPSAHSGADRPANPSLPPSSPSCHPQTQFPHFPPPPLPHKQLKFWGQVFFLSFYHFFPTMTMASLRWQNKRLKANIRINKSGHI